MPTKGEKDIITGTELRDHEWDGIRELDTPLPKWWVYVFYATILWSVVYFILYPAIPLWNSATPGILGYTTRGAHSADMEQARAERAEVYGRIDAASLDEVMTNDELRQIAMVGGRYSYLDNCAGCHGTGAAGGPGYPSLVDDAWIWGGSPEAILVTLQHGVRWDQDDDTRFSEMPNFGADELLTTEEIGDVADYVLTLSGQEPSSQEAADRGAVIFSEQCVACHEAGGAGNRELGAPALNDRIWLYGGSREEIIAQTVRARHGVMPAWSERLSPATLKMLTVYVHSLGGGE